MVTHPGTWKSVLILSHTLDTRRTLFQGPTDASLETWTQQLSILLWKFQFLCQVIKSCLCHGYLLVVFPSTVVLSLCSESELYSMLPSSSGKRDLGHGVLEMVLVLSIYSLEIYHAEIPVRNMIFSCPPNHWNRKWHTLPFTIPSIPQVFCTCFTANVGSK